MGLNLTAIVFTRCRSRRAHVRDVNSGMHIRTDAWDRPASGLGILQFPDYAPDLTRPSNWLVARLLKGSRATQVTKPRKSTVLDVWRQLDE